MKEKTFQRSDLEIKVVSRSQNIPQRVRSEAQGVLKNTEKTAVSKEDILYEQEIDVNGGYPDKYGEILRKQQGGALHGIAVFMLCKLLQRETDYRSLDGIKVEPTEDWTNKRPDVRVEGSTILGEAGFVQPKIGFSSPNTVALMDRFASLATDYYQSTGNKPVGMKLFHIPFRHKGRKKNLHQLDRSDIPRAYREITALSID